jgi:hypothetical protein
MRTYGDLVGTVRMLLMDIPREGFNSLRWDDDLIYAQLTNAVNDIKAGRADLFLPDYINVSSIIVTTANKGDPFPLDDVAFLPLAYRTAGYVSLADDEFVMSGRAQQFMVSSDKLLFGGSPAIGPGDKR